MSKTGSNKGRLVCRLALAVALALSMLSFSSCYEPTPPPSSPPESIQPPSSPPENTQPPSSPPENTQPPLSPPEGTPPVSSPPESAPLPPSSPDGTLEVIYLDVGQANAALLSSEGHHMLIDGGKAKDSQLIFTVLSDRQITSLDCIVFSHTDEDHVGGLSGALEYAKADACYGPSAEYGTRAFNSFKDRLTGQGVAITVPEARLDFALGSATVTVWHLQRDTGDSNDNELIVRVVNGDDSFLFPGDIPTKLENMLIDLAGAEVESDVLLVPHHGSDTSSGYRFLREVGPSYCVISSGNRYGHPTEDVLSRYRDLGTVLLRTDMFGDITFISGADGLRYSTQKSPQGDVYTPGTK